MNGRRIAFWAATGMLCALMFLSAGLYMSDHSTVVMQFRQLGYPEHLVLPLAIAKIFGALSILTRISPTLTEWAYAGFFFDLSLATLAHHTSGVEGIILPVFGLICWVLSYFLAKDIFRT